MKTLYETEALSAGDGRNGQAWTVDRTLELDLGMPKSLGGSGVGTNPEQLFAVGYAACFHNALLIVGRQAHADMEGSTVGAKVCLGLTDEQDYQLAVALEVTLPNIDAHEASSLVDKAHAMCPYSRATRGNIEVLIELAEN